MNCEALIGRRLLGDRRPIEALLEEGGWFLWTTCDTLEEIDDELKAFLVERFDGQVVESRVTLPEEYDEERGIIFHVMGSPRTINLIDVEIGLPISPPPRAP